MIHDLKIAPEYYGAVLSGKKTFEVRRDDRPYAVGDGLRLREYKGHGYTGREITVEVSYVLRDPNYCKEGFCILGIIPADPRENARLYCNQ